MDGTRDLPIKDTPAKAEPRGNRRRLQQSGEESQRGSDEDRREVGDDLHPVVVRETLVGREIYGCVLDRRGERVGENLP